jgi:hypothetical protein
MPPSEYLFEWLGSAIASRMGIATPEPLVVAITPALVSSAPDAFRDELQRSIGLVFGSHFLGVGQQMPRADHLSSLELKRAARILAFDVLIHNADRRAVNPNLLIDRDELVVFDHELAFGFLLAIGAPDPVTDHCPEIVVSHALRQAALRAPPKPAAIRRAIALLSDGFFTDLEAVTPVEWTVDGARGKLDKLVDVLKQRRDAVDEWLPKVLACLKP